MSCLDSRFKFIYLYFRYKHIRMHDEIIKGAVTGVEVVLRGGKNRD